MDLLEDLFDLGKRKRRKNGGFLPNKDNHDDDHDDDHHRRHQYPANVYVYPQSPENHV